MANTWSYLRLAIPCLLLATTLARAEITGALSLDVGIDHSCILSSTGGMRCWGRNFYGELGTFSDYRELAASDVATLSSGVSSFALGDNHTCAVTTAGNVKCWGRNQSGQIGNGDTSQQNIPVAVAGLTGGITTVAAAISHTCSLSNLGEVRCWGANSSGQLGNGGTTQSNVAVNVNSLSSGVSSIGAGGNTSCAITNGGGLLCWGSNSSGQLGDGTTTQRTVPVNVTGLSVGVISVAVGSTHTCALTTASGVKCWGNNSGGQLGDGSTTQRNTAVDVTGLTSGITSIAAGAYHTCAVTSTGTAKCWGYNYYRTLGDGTSSNRSNGVDVLGLANDTLQVAAGELHTCALTTQGTVKCWGSGSVARLGDGTTQLRYTPQSVPSLTTGVTHLSAGGAHNCVVTTGGSANCWGLNTSGQLGDGTATNSLSPVQVLGLSVGVSRIVSGSAYSCAVTTAGSAHCWGINAVGNLGDGTTTNRLTPVDVLGLSTGVVDIALYHAHTCAVTTSGGVKCWGRNNWGELGDGTTTSRTTPTDVLGLSNGIAVVTVGTRSSCALSTQGGVKCWGANTWGQIGDGTNTHKYTPTDVIGLSSSVIAIDAGEYHACAVKALGDIKCWGSKSDGELGAGTISDGNIPVAVIGLPAPAVSVTAGHSHTCASLTTGSISCWGSNYYGEIGDDSDLQRDIAVPAKQLNESVSLVSAGGLSGQGHTCALTTNGAVKCWGSNEYGQLGDPFDLSMRTVVLGLFARGEVTLSGIPLAGVTFRADEMGPFYSLKEATTDGSGTYALPLVESAPYTITPELAGYTFSPPSISGTMASDLTQDFVATLVTYNITGTATASGNPLSGASVDGGALGIQVTDGSGAYSFAGILPGTVYTLSISHPGVTFGTSTASGTLHSHATHDFSGTLSTHSLSGVITVGGSPSAGVAINGGALGNTTSDINGAYSFTGVDYGTSYTLTPNLTDHTFSPTSISGTVTGDAALDFTGVYNPPTTTSTSTVAATTTVPTTTTAPTTTVAITSTVGIASTVHTTSSVTATTTGASSSVPSSTTVANATTIATTTVPADSDGDGLTDAEEEAVGTDPEVADSDGDGVADGEEISTGTNPNDPGSKATKLRTTLCSDWNSYLAGPTGRGMYNIMEHINLTSKKVLVKTELRNIRGHLKDTYEFFLRGNQQFDLLVHDMGGREVNSYGQVCTTYERAPAGSLDGRMVYYKYGDDNNIQFAFALPFENPIRGTSALPFNTGQPSLAPQDSANLVANWVQLSNVSKKRLTGKLYFYSLTGAKLGSYNVNLRDGARYDYSGHAWGQQAGLVRFVPEDTSVDYQLRGIRYLYDNPSGLDSFTSAYPFSAAVGSGETLMAPVDTGDSTSGNSTSAVLEVSNTLGKKVSVALKLYDNAGKKLIYSKTHSLMGYSSLHLPLDTVLLHSTGLMTAKGSQAGSIIGSVVHYGRTTVGGVKNLYATPLREPVGTTFKGSYNTYLNQSCTLYLGNSATSKEKVTVSLRQNDGTSPVKNYSLTVPGRGVFAEDVCAKSPKNVYGVVTVTATKPKHISGIIVRNGEGERYKMATALR